MLTFPLTYPLGAEANPPRVIVHPVSVTLTLATRAPSLSAFTRAPTLTLTTRKPTLTVEDA